MRTGAPIARALIYAYPDDEALVNVDDQHLLGKDLLCAPVVEDNQPQRVVAFPRGAWIDWETGERFMGPQRRRVDSPLDVLPLFVREGAVIPLGPVMQYTGELAEEPLTLACYLAEVDERQQVIAQGELYEDDGETPAYQEGWSRRVSLTAMRSGLQLTFRAESPSGAYVREWSCCTVEFHVPYLPGNRRPQAESAAIDGHGLDPKSIRVTLRRYETLLSVPISSVTPPCELQVTLLAPD
jgi:alpha-glucosidase